MARWNFFTYYDHIGYANPLQRQIKLSATEFGYISQVYKLLSKYYPTLAFDEVMKFHFTKGKLRYLGINLIPLSTRTHFGLFWEELISILRTHPTIHTLSLANCEKKMMNPFSFLKSWKKLRALHFFGTSFETFPEFLLQMDNLQEIIIHDGYLTEIPLWVSQMKNLHHLSLPENKVERIPNVSNPKVFFKDWRTIGSNPFRTLNGFDEHGIASLVRYYLSKTGGASALNPYFDKYLPTHLTQEGLALFRRIFSQITDIQGFTSKLNQTRDAAAIRFLINSCQNEIQDLLQYYSSSPRDLVQSILQGKKLTPSEEQRLIHEINWKEKQLLEINLPANHAVLKKLNSHSVSLPGEHMASLFL